MSKADVLQLASDLSMNLVDQTTVDRYYRDVVFDLGETMLHTAVSLVPSTHVTSQYTIPDYVCRVLGIIYDDQQLSLETTKSLDYLDPTWRTRRGAPSAYIREKESDRNFAIYPAPEFPSKDFSFVHGDPMGADYPGYAIALLHTESRDNVLVYIELAVALRILAFDFARESNHQDPAFSSACAKLGDLLLRLVS